MRKWICRLIPLMSLLAAAAVAAETPEHWPLDLPGRYLTSNFMEYRPGRFHAGLDFKTQSRQGFPVRAVEDGVISRVRSSPGAYGRAVYLQGNSGRTYVYAHLMRFNDDLRHRVRNKQSELGRYRVQLTWGEGGLPVKAGDVLGLSGQSGTNGPHLHFEVRDAEQRPLNPVVQGFAPADTFAPVIHTIRAWPTTAAAAIQGAAVEHVIAVDGAAALPPLHVSGPVAFSARIVDQADIRGHRLEPWRIEVMVDGTPVYTCVNDRFSFSENSLQRLEWATGPWPGSGLREHWLHRRDGADLHGRAGSQWYAGPSGEGLAPGTHRVQIIAEDRAGGRAETAFDLVVGSDESGPWTPESRGLRGDGTLVVTPFFQTGVAAGTAHLRRLSPEAGDPVLVETWLVTRTADAAEELAAARAQDLIPEGPAALFAAADWAVDGPVPVTWPGAVTDLADNPAAGVYRFDDRDGWTWVGPPDQSGGMTGFALAKPGLHAVLRDDTPPILQDSTAPVVVDLGPGGNVAGVTLPRWAVFPLAVSDTGSGVAAATLRVELNGGRLIVEPDLIRDRVLVELPDSLAPGRHSLTVEATDEAGNTAARTYQLFCSGKAP